MGAAADTERERGWRSGLLALLCYLFAVAVNAQSILNRRVTVHAEQVRLSTALSLLAREGGFKLSYNAAVVPGDSSVNVDAVEEKVQRVLEGLLPGHLRWKESGGHLIITGEVGRKQRFSTAGSVVDAHTGTGIARASVFEVRRSHAVITTDAGAFTIELSGELERTPLRISRHGYQDTIVFVQRDGTVGRVALSPLDEPDRIDPICHFDRCGVEELGMARLLVPASQMDQAYNLDFTERRTWQFSLIPTVSSNGEISGSVINRYSFNLLGGYARGLEGVEVGGVINMESDDVRGLQIGGVANLVGGHTRGVQLAGGINHSMRSLEGLQVAGLGNTVWDTLGGVQLAGGANIVKRGMTGTQIVGGANVSLGDLNGVQVAGGVNVTHGTVNKAQVAGGLNYARSVNGGQVAAGVNVSLDNVGGGQVGLGSNYARTVSGGQVTFGINVAWKEVEGGQVGVLNVAGRCLGGQVGILNFSDTISGGAVGILTVALKGYHRLDVISNDLMPLSLRIRTGTREFHNILGYSPPVAEDQRWGFLYGFGFEPKFGTSFLNIDLTAEQITEQLDWVDAMNIVGRFGISYGVLIKERLAITAGPAFNVLFTDWRDRDTGEFLSRLAPADPLFEELDHNRRISGWLGWNASVGLRF